MSMNTSVTAAPCVTCGTVADEPGLCHCGITGNERSGVRGFN